ncbi:hypothetical protein, partial [Staphylococcus pseudintermedius]
LSLTVPTTKPVTDFHRQDVTHAGRTETSENLVLFSLDNCSIDFCYTILFSDDGAWLLSQ